MDERINSLTEKQFNYYFPLFRKYPGRWTLRNDITWAPGNAIFDKNAKEQVDIMDIGTETPDIKKIKANMAFALITLMNNVGYAYFNYLAYNWLKHHKENYLD